MPARKVISRSKRPPANEGMNELTFVGWLGTETALRAERKRSIGDQPLIASGEIEERQVDAEGHIRRCDIRLNSEGGRKLASGEMKRPEVPEGRDPRNEALREDARQKALARGLPFYFTCNMAEVVLYAVASHPGDDDREESSVVLAPLVHSSEVEAYRHQIAANWALFLDDLETRLAATSRARPSVTTGDVLAIREAINGVAQEALQRVTARINDDKAFADQVRDEAADTFGFAAALKSEFPAHMREELLQMLRFGVFVVAQKLILYRVLEDAGPRRREPFNLDELSVPRLSTDPAAIRALLDAAFAQAMDRSRDYETAFLPTPLARLVFLSPASRSESQSCLAGEVWDHLLEAVRCVSWVSISQNLIGFLYEVIVDPQFRHQLGQFYTREDVVDVLTTFAVRDAADVVLDPAAGGGSFLRSVYRRKRDLGDNHEDALSHCWGFEITAVAAELSTITLATSDTTEAAAYPRVLLLDFFDARPGAPTSLMIPADEGPLHIPEAFDAVVGNPPYISYRWQTNHSKVINALARSQQALVLPRFSGKSDAYVWFIAHATEFLNEGGRLAFVVSSAVLFADYGIPLIRFLSHHFKIRAVVDSVVERWFPDADTNTVLLLLERCSDADRRAANSLRFVRLRRPLAQLLAPPNHTDRRDTLEDLIQLILQSPAGGNDPRLIVNVLTQGVDAGLEFAERGTLEDEDES